MTTSEDRWQLIEARELQVGDRLRTGPDEAALEAVEVQLMEAENMSPHMSVTWVAFTGAVTRDLIASDDKLQVLRGWALGWRPRPVQYPHEHETLVKALRAAGRPADARTLAGLVPRRRERGGARDDVGRDIQHALDTNHLSYVDGLLDAAVAAGVVLRIDGHRHVVPPMPVTARLFKYPHIRDWMLGPVCQCSMFGGRNTDHEYRVTVYALAGETVSR